MLTRARGGLILDELGEQAHLITLCRVHHNFAHTEAGYEAGLMIDGYVTTGADGRAVYQGSDARLRHLQPMAVPVVRDQEERAEPGTGVRGQA